MFGDGEGGVGPTFGLSFEGQLGAKWYSPLHWKHLVQTPVRLLWRCKVQPSPFTLFAFPLAPPPPFRFSPFPFLTFGAPPTLRNLSPSPGTSRYRRQPIHCGGLLFASSVPHRCADLRVDACVPPRPGNPNCPAHSPVSMTFRIGRVPLSACTTQTHMIRRWPISICISDPASHRHIWNSIKKTSIV